MDEAFDDKDILIIREVLKKYIKILEKPDVYINNVDNETNLISCQRILKKRLLSQLTIEEWSFIYDIMEHYYEIIKIKHYSPFNYKTYDSDESFDTWFSMIDCDRVLNKIDRHISIVE